ncbi:kinase-like domain-containing protein [Stachybotrys elegans]|uniref:non-specific serine/threonine protein kinase n=1 Tax=Stachybotrys elegans TaxID=80388 RepID=A0A8K0SLB3_9HYPO|nr:kinase-like domain-containing protein [Stachybotrys elegans]
MAHMSVHSRCSVLYFHSWMPSSKRRPSKTYKCDIDAEPLHRYRPGGYHPVLLGDVLHHGRYKIIHKMGWGGYATTWAAKDQKTPRYVALKISVAEIAHRREVQVLRGISGLPNSQPGASNSCKLLDHFNLDGPNGLHDCLVLELLGPSVSDIVEWCCKDDRLSADLAKSISRQALQGLDFIARNGIVHGDIHVRNLAVEIPGIHRWTEDSFYNKLGTPVTAAVSSLDSEPLPSSVPSYIVQPIRFSSKHIPSSPTVKIIDFGEAFLEDDAPATLHTPLAVRAPEIIFGDTLDKRVDLWSAGCLLFELVTGQPPFDTMMMTPPELVQQMLEFDRDGVPMRWQRKWQEMQAKIRPQDPMYTLQQWLEEVYFENDRETGFTADEIRQLGELVSSMLKIEPSRRATARQVLDSPWFKE